MKERVPPLYSRTEKRVLALARVRNDKPVYSAALRLRGEQVFGYLEE